MGNKWKQWQTSFSWAPKSLKMVTASMKVKDILALWKKSYDKPRQCIQKQRHNFANKGAYSQSYGFSSCHIQMWELDHKEGWVPKNLPSQILWRRLLRVPWTVKMSNQSILKEINPEYSLKALMMKLKLQYSGHLMQRDDSLEKTLMLVKIDDSRWNGWMAWVWANSERQFRTGKHDVQQSMESESQTWLSDLTTTYKYKYLCYVHLSLPNFIEI